MSSIQERGSSAPVAKEVGVTLNEARIAACQIRRAGVEHLAPTLDIYHGREIVAFVRTNRAFIGLYPIARKLSPEPIHMNPKRDLGVELGKLLKRRAQGLLGAEQEAGETQMQWAKRMGLLPPWIAGYDADGEPIYRENVDMHRHSRTREEEARIRQLTDRDVNVEFMSIPDQREFRWNNPEGYEQWVEDLKEEMGVHFNEDLVLPPYKTKPCKKLSWKEIDEDLDDMYEKTGSYIAPGTGTKQGDLTIDKDISAQ